MSKVHIVAHYLANLNNHPLVSEKSEYGLNSAIDLSREDFQNLFSPMGLCFDEEVAGANLDHYR